MILKVSDILNRVFSKLQVATRGINTDATEMSNALTELNIMLDELSASTLMCMGSIMQSFTLTGGKSSYTIGPSGADLTGVRPMDITDAFVRDPANADYPLEILSLGQFNSINDKAITTGTPLRLYYATGAPQQAVGTGTVQLYPIPDIAYTIYLGEQQALKEFSALTDVVTFLPVYYSLIIWNLTERLYPEFPVMDDKSFATVLKMARRSERAVETLNFKKIASGDMNFPTDTNKGRFNIMSGEYA